MSNLKSTKSVIPSLTQEEQEVLENLDLSIKFHESFSDNEETEPKVEGDFEDSCSDLSEDKNLTFTVPQSYHPFNLPAIPESHETSTDGNQRRESKSDNNINAGYILFDGSEIKYVNHKRKADSKHATSVSTDRFSSIKSRTSTTTQISDTTPVNFYMSADELFDQDLKNITGFDDTRYSRLPTNSHFSLREKMYFIFIGLACVISFNSIYISVAYFRQILNDQVLSILGTCHYATLLVAMAMVFLAKRTWFQFIPTVTMSFILMSVVVASFPILSLLGVSYPRYLIYILVSLNGLCSGFALAVTDRMVLLFPGGKSSMFFRLGGGLGCFLPAIIELIAILIDFKEKGLSILIERNTFNLYIVFPISFLGIFLGFMSAIKLSRSGIYGLFADIDNFGDNPRCATIFSSRPIVRRQRCKKLAAFLLVEFLVAVVTWYCLSVAQYIHVKTLTHYASNKSPFWTVHLTTVLIGIYQFGDIIGSLLGSFSRYCSKSLPNKFLNGLYLLLSILRFGSVISIVFFIASPFLVYENIFMMGLYSLLALTNGSLLVAMAIRSHSICDVQRKDLCPIISQVTWLSIQCGCLVGVVLSFIPFS